MIRNKLIEELNIIEMNFRRSALNCINMEAIEKANIIEEAIKELEDLKGAKQ